MNIGDKVRFLNTVGGGKITGFQGKDIVLVCDEDGFEIPTLRSEVVVIETDNYNFVRPESKEKNMPRKSADTRTGIKAALAEHHHSDDEEEEEQDPADREMTFRTRPIERRGGDVLNLHIGFVPVDRNKSAQHVLRLISSTTPTTMFAALSSPKRENCIDCGTTEKSNRTKKCFSKN